MFCNKRLFTCIAVGNDKQVLSYRLFTCIASVGDPGFVLHRLFTCIANVRQNQVLFIVCLHVLQTLEIHVLFIGLFTCIAVGDPGFVYRLFNMYYRWRSMVCLLLVYMDLRWNTCK